jgi:SAM-dependent methyltransferase
VSRWADIWAARRLDASRGSTLAQLMAADGLDTAFGSLTEDSWRAFVVATGHRLGAAAGTPVFEVGCGAGAFLWPLHERGCRVSGIDRSAVLIDYARAAMPEGRFDVADAAAVDPTEPFDIVAACGVFMYFDTLHYAQTVLEAMARKATRALAILDVPDVALRDDAMRLRRGALGEREYEARYRGLDHLYYERDWFVRRLRNAGWPAVTVEPQAIGGYANGAHRFNVFAARA